MRVLGLEIKRAGSLPQGHGAWWPLVREVSPGGWQRNEKWTVDTVLAHHAVYACVTLIATDVGKLHPRLTELGADGIWRETHDPEVSPLLRKPNRYQNHIQFKEWWLTSKLIRGNTYALKERGEGGRVTALYLMDPNRVQVLVAPDGSVFYSLGEDNLSGIREDRTVPASEVIHDRMNCLFHPLVGISPIFASGMAATVGQHIEKNAAGFFGQGSNPSGVLTHPQSIKQETADRLAEKWNELYSGENAGKVAVLTEGLQFEPLRMSAVDSQMIEHLKWTAETVCTTFHVPAFKLGIGQQPTHNNAEMLNQIYYSDCLQSHIEAFEESVGDGLGLHDPEDRGRLAVTLDLDDLLRMDKESQVRTFSEGVKGAVYAPNEARRKLGLAPLQGGDTVYMQQQNYSLAALDARDRDNPLGNDNPDPPIAEDRRAAFARRVRMRALPIRMRASAWTN